MKRRVLCLILAVIMVACLLPTAAFASTNGKTADDAINWVRSLEGQPVGNGECVELIRPLRAAMARIIRGISSPPAGTDYKTHNRRRATFWSTAAMVKIRMAMSRSMNRITAPGTRTLPVSAKSSTLQTSDITALRTPIGASSARTLAARYLSRTLSTSAQTSTVISSARTNGCPPERAMTKTQSGM